MTRTLPLLLLALAPAVADVRRGSRTLEEAIARATGRAQRVAVVIDVTPYTARQQPVIQRALAARTAVREWQVARLGEPMGEPIASLPALTPVFVEPSDVDNTLAALRVTLRATRNCTVVYLADWHFEDDENLEGFIRFLKHQGLTLSVVGSEAAFGHGWNDGFYPALKARIGRNAFASRGAPWHGGDTAYCHLPFYFHMRWQTKFPSERAPTPRWEDIEKSRYAKKLRRPRKGPDKDEDLHERVDDVDPKALEHYAFPLPSAFGPYGLSRATKESGGNYVLWSWNPEGRSDVTYDYARCHLFAPDLRSRSDIRKEIARRPHARALIRAWHEIANRDIHVALVTPPVARDAARPVEMREVRGDGGLHYHWTKPVEHETFLLRGVRTAKALDRAIAILSRKVKPRDAVDRRYHADADLLRHTLLTLRFQIAQAVAAARLLPRNAWKDPKLIPGLDPEWWILRGPDVASRKIRVYDPKLAEILKADRIRMLERYAGTPFGEMVRRNGVFTYKLAWRPVRSGRPAKETPADSSGKRGPTTPPGGGSGGGGPTSGG